MRKNRTRFFVGLIVALSILATSAVGGYFVIDKVLVPQYFGQYGINNLSELVNIVQTIYIVPDEKEFITNSFSDFDKSSATSKLTSAGFPTLKNGKLDYETIARNDFEYTPDEKFVDNFILLNDKEVASIASGIIESGILATDYPGLQAIDILNIELKQIIVTPNNDTLKENEKQDLEDLNPNSYEKYIKATTPDANITLTVKLDTVSARQQIASNLNMPKFLVDWIIPDSIYVTSSMDTKIDENGNRIYENSTVSINSKTPKQSEILLKLLLSFIFPDNSYTIDSFANELCSLAIQGIQNLGNMEFATIEQSSGIETSGIKLFLF